MARQLETKIGDLDALLELAHDERRLGPEETELAGAS